ncbi:MAG TPA: hypothetical protein VET45_16540 [Candidatus Binatia bacterium]|nr:hypothetical protein [Candidatus Binatia bacterium]
MTLEGPSGVAPCQECGTVGCRSCAIHVDTHTYCRWCAMVVARRVA